MTYCIHCHDAETQEGKTRLDDIPFTITELLADFYGIDGARGSKSREVKVPGNQPRGGLLGMAAIHAMGSDGQRSSPVERGARVMRKLLDDPPPPAPANVPQLSRHAGKLLSACELRDRKQSELLAYLIDRLKVSKGPDGSTLFDNVCLAYGSNIQGIHYLTNCPCNAGAPSSNSTFPPLLPRWKFKPSSTAARQAMPEARTS